MAKGVGLDSGEFEVKAVELDGTFRKPRLTKVHIESVSQATAMVADPLHATREAEALLQAIKAAKIHKQNVTLGFPSRETLFRQLMVPFTGEDRIRKVIKFEAEGEIHSASVDDMVVDFHVVEEIDDETRVLVAGVPKTTLRQTLSALERVGIEPEVVDLDTMALLRVAEWSGALTPDDNLVDAGSDAANSRLILDFGARSVRLLVVTDGHLNDMRAIPIGGDTIAEDVALRHGLSMAQARHAVEHCLATGQDYDPASAPAEVQDDVEEDEEFVLVEDGEEEDVEETGVALPTIVPAAVVQEARVRYFARMRQEFMRFLVSVKGIGDIEAAFTTGAGSLIPGLPALLEDVFGCQPQPLLFMELLQHEFSEDEVAYYEPRIVVAVGLALGQMGGVGGFNFRQEELVYTRGFDRMKLPLAVACMLGLFAMVVWGMVLQKQLTQKEHLYGFAVEKETGRATRRQNTQAGDTYMQYTGYLGHLVNRSGSWPGKRMKHDEYRDMVNKIAKAPTFSRINHYSNDLKAYLKRVQSEGEYDPSLALSSGVAVLQEFAVVLRGVEEGLGQFYVGEVELNLPKERNSKGKLIFRVFFRGPDFPERKAALEAAFRQAFKDEKSAFVDFSQPAREDTVPAENSAFYEFFIELKQDIPVL